jgi:tRNA A-37 threonylcarbamoyl transferase component Bud32
MAEIFLARAFGLDGFEKLVVLKSLLAQRADDQAWVQMFLDEARLAATLVHSNIAQVFDVGRDKDLHFFTMEYVHGADLREIITAAEPRGGVPLEVALAITVGVAAGLHYAHEKTDSAGQPLNIVHRDVSPSNVLVSYDGAVKVVDFGIAKAAVRRAATRTGTVKGKAGYMSPEQCRGEALDQRSDVFAIGILLYQLTTGVAPFTGENEYAIIRRVVDEDARPPSEVKADYPRGLEAIVLRALRRPRDERYATAQELQVDLETFAREQGLGLSNVEVARFMEELFGQRRQSHFEALAALVGEKQALALSSTFVAFRDGRTRGRRVGTAVAAGAVLLAAGAFAAFRAGLVPGAPGRREAVAEPAGAAPGARARAASPVGRPTIHQVSSPAVAPEPAQAPAPAEAPRAGAAAADRRSGEARPRAAAPDPRRVAGKRARPASGTAGAGGGPKKAARPQRPQPRSADDGDLDAPFPR